jgi:hypothetical protein
VPRATLQFIIDTNDISAINRICKINYRRLADTSRNHSFAAVQAISSLCCVSFAVTFVKEQTEIYGMLNDIQATIPRHLSYVVGTKLFVIPAVR